MFYTDKPMQTKCGSSLPCDQSQILVHMNKTILKETLFFTQLNNRHIPPKIPHFLNLLHNYTKVDNINYI